MDTEIDEFCFRKIARAGTIIRPYAPMGNYWPGDFRAPTAAYIAGKGIIVTACHFDEAQHEGEYYTEFDTPMIEEIRLLAALALPVRYADGVIAPYPYYHEIRIEDQHDLRGFEISSDIIDHMRTTFSSHNFSPWREGPPPPMFGGPEYDFRDACTPSKLQQRIFNAIDPADSLLVRGLASLIKSYMLTRHRQFFESAIAMLYVSLDASFNLVLRELRAKGARAPTAYDAQVFIENLFGEELSGRRYFEEYYQDRVRVMHPHSRLGLFPYPPIMHDDFFGLYDGLREIYRYLIINEAVR